MCLSKSDVGLDDASASIKTLAWGNPTAEGGDDAIELGELSQIGKFKGSNYETMRPDSAATSPWMLQPL